MKAARTAWGVGLLLLLACRGAAAPATMGILTLGTSPSLTAVLELIADDQGFFRAEGLQVDVREVASVREALDDALAGKLDLVAGTALPVVDLGFQRNDFRIIGTVADLANDNVVVARRDRGIQQVADLRGKRVGTSKNLMPHYMLDMLLRKHSLSNSAVNLSFAYQSNLVAALGAGELDGAALFGRHIDRARRDLGSNAVVFSDPALFEIKTYVVGRAALVKQRAPAMEQFLRACLQAERFVAAEPEAAMAIAARRLQMDLADVRQAWPHCHFAVAFPQAMLNDLEGKARWQIESGLAPGRRIPNYLDVLYYQGLERVNPQRVTLIH